jgi:hypothetical protein
MGVLLRTDRKIDAENAENTRWVNGNQGGIWTELLMPHAKYSKTRWRSDSCYHNTLNSNPHPLEWSREASANTIVL